jgi:hypothetical protein
MARTYDLFEILPDGVPLWRTSVDGDENAIAKLKTLSRLTSNEVYAMHVPSKSVIARMGPTEFSNSAVA